MRKIESFSNEQALLGRIDQLKSSGVAERDMHVISKSKLDGSALDYTDVQYKNAEGSFGDKVASLFTGEDAQYRMFDKLNLSDSEKNQYVNEVEAGKILLYVDNDEAYNNVDNYSSDHPMNSQKGNDYYDGHKDETIDRDRTGSTVGGFTTGVAAGNLNNEYQNNEIREENDTMFNNNNDKLDRENELDRNERLNNLDPELRDRTDLTDDEKIRLHEERLRVDKDVVQTGEVQIDKDIVEERQQFDVPVSRDEVTVERRKVNEVQDGSFNADLDEETIRVPLTEERINVQKENVVTEELVIKKNRVQDTAHVDETIRKEEVDITDTQDTHVRDNDRLDRVDNDDLTDRR